MCFCAEAKLDTDWGHAAVQTLHATRLACCCLKERCSGALQTCLRQQDRKINPHLPPFHLGSRVVRLSV